MKRTNFIVIILFLLLLSFPNFLNAETFELNEDSIESMFNDSEDITEKAMFQLEQLSKVGYSSVFSMNRVSDDEEVNKELLAGILVLVVPFFSWPVPIHRLLIGVNGAGTKIWAAYCFTFGGCGVISLVDAIVLIIDGADGGSKYMNNDRFIMWGK